MTDADSLAGMEMKVQGQYYPVCGWTDESVWVKSGFIISGPWKREDVELREMKTTREYILDEAKRCVLKDRNTDYDEPERNFQDIAMLWNAYLQGKQEIEPHDVGILCLLIKVARIRKSPKKADHYIDGAGYFSCAADCAGVEPVTVDMIDAETGEEKYRMVGYHSGCNGGSVEREIHGQQETYPDPRDEPMCGSKCRCKVTYNTYNWTNALEENFPDYDWKEILG